MKRKATERYRAPKGTRVVRRWRNRRALPLYVMLFPGLISIILFNIMPMYGIVIAFQKFNPMLGFIHSPFIGLGNFERVFSSPDIWTATRNTLLIATGKIMTGQVVSLLVALLLNEIRNRYFKRSVQTVTYLLYFLSWVILGGIVREILSLSGLVNHALALVGLERVLFLGEPAIFPFTVILTDVWKNFGFGAVVYLAALTSIEPSLLEAAAVDGAGRFQRVWSVVLPAISSTIVIMVVLNMGSILDAGMEQILILYNPLVYETGDIIDTFVYRVGFQGAQYSLGAAVGLLKSTVGMIMIGASLYLARRIAKYRVL